jgi:hypothetical protein
MNVFTKPIWRRSIFSWEKLQIQNKYRRWVGGFGGGGWGGGELILAVCSLSSKNIKPLLNHTQMPCNANIFFILSGSEFLSILCLLLQTQKGTLERRFCQFTGSHDCQNIQVPSLGVAQIHPANTSWIKIL